MMQDTVGNFSLKAQPVMKPLDRSMNNNDNDDDLKKWNEFIKY